jgi:hypothetical protein
VLVRVVVRVVVQLVVQAAASACAAKVRGGRVVSRAICSQRSAPPVSAHIQIILAADVPIIEKKLYPSSVCKLKGGGQ